MRCKKILAAVDFSPLSQEALRVAAELAAQWDSELELIHVWQPATYTIARSPAFPNHLVDDLLREAEGGLDDWKHRAEQYGAKRVTARVLTGVAWHEIVEVSREGYDLIVIGTHGRTGLKHALLGSVAEKVVRHAPIATLVVRSAD
ncbi:MAG TPA: universal stress protein [Kofleriaceae bacterium]|nr:universal stress protein [Kofleriaceae bacterium]